MITRTELRTIARARIKDAQVLLRGGRYDGAVYLCGYAVELALKARICKVLRWKGFPSTQSEFKSFASFKVHALDILLQLAGCEAKVKSLYMTEWSVVAQWDPEARYRPVGSANRADTILMIDSAEALLKAL